MHATGPLAWAVMSGPPSSATPAAERLLNLVIALVNTPGRMTKEQVRSSVAGYDQSSVEAFERMFERDKDTLRDLGIPVLTVTGAAHGDDQGYRVDADAWELPPLELSAAQLGVLGLAARLWSDRTLQTDAARGLTKLRVVGEAAAQDDVVAGLTPRVHAGGPALAPLLDAAHERRVVAFTYRTASTGEVRRRQVEPWRLVASGGGWYLVGHDRDRGASRVFRLSRIVGAVRTVGEPDAFEVPAEADPVAMVAASQREGRRTAWLAVAPGRAGALRARAEQPGEPEEPSADVPAAPDPSAVPEGSELVAVPYERTAELAEEVAAYTDAVLVLGPADLRDAVVRRLRAAAALGAGPHAADPGEARPEPVEPVEHRG